MNRPRRYYSYMLRLWETSNGEKQIWRASLESPGSGQRRGFANLQTLIDYLQSQIEGSDEEEGQNDLRGRGGAATDA